LTHTKPGPPPEAWVATGLEVSFAAAAAGAGAGAAGAAAGAAGVAAAAGAAAGALVPLAPYQV
jgi:hypothetical protein